MFHRIYEPRFSRIGRLQERTDIGGIICLWFRPQQANPRPVGYAYLTLHWSDSIRGRRQLYPYVPFLPLFFHICGYSTSTFERVLKGPTFRSEWDCPHTVNAAPPLPDSKSREIFVQGSPESESFGFTRRFRYPLSPIVWVPATTVTRPTQTRLSSAQGMSALEPPWLGRDE